LENSTIQGIVPARKQPRGTFQDGSRDVTTKSALGWFDALLLCIDVNVELICFLLAFSPYFKHSVPAS
jgi:hypothetical protein